MDFKVKGLLVLIISLVTFTLLIYFDFSYCYLKFITGLPCPSCGTTRALESIYQFDFLKSLHFNPLGIIVVFIFLIYTLLLANDFIKKENKFELSYKSIEKKLKDRKYLLILMILIVLNWVWNFYKGY